MTCLVLAGCGGGGGGTFVETASFDALRTEIAAHGVTPISRLPTGGTHDYAGLMQLNLPVGTAPRETYQGQFELSLAFDRGAVDATGDATGFTSESGNVLGGALAFGGGTLMLNADPARDFLFFAEIDGQLTDGGVPYDLSAQIAADLHGMDAVGVTGLIFGGAISNGADFAEFDGALAGQGIP